MNQVAYPTSTLALVVNLPPNTKVGLSIFDARTALPAWLRSSFTVRKEGAAIVFSYDWPYALSDVRDDDLRRALQAMINAGYVASIEGSTIRVTEPAPIPFAEAVET